MERKYEVDYEIVYANCHEAAESLGYYNILKENITNGTVVYKTDVSSFSWGETFKVRISRINSSTTCVSVESSSVLPSWGRNDTNMSEFLSTLSKLLKT